VDAKPDQAKSEQRIAVHSVQMTPRQFQNTQLHASDLRLFAQLLPAFLVKEDDLLFVNHFTV
jgi:hypothetical protein